MSPSLKVAKTSITHLSLGLSPQNQQNFQGHGNSSGQLTKHMRDLIITLLPGAKAEIYKKTLPKWQVMATRYC